MTAGKNRFWALITLDLISPLSYYFLEGAALHSRCSLMPFGELSTEGSAFVF